MNARDWYDGPSIMRPLDPLARAIEAATEEDVILFTIALVRRERERADTEYRDCVLYLLEN